MRESHIEKYLSTRIKQLGGLCWKFTSPQVRGVPDRVVLLPEGVVAWVEVKAPGQKPTSQQLRRHQELISLDHDVAVLDSIEAVDAFLEGCMV